MSIKSLSLKDQINYVLGCLQNAKIPKCPDRYLGMYQTLLEDIQGYTENPTPESLVAAGKLVYKWMPRCAVGFTPADMKPIGKLVGKAQSDILTEPDITAIAQSLRPAGRGKSVVAASKLLHFIAPDKYPIFDSKIRKAHWGGTMTAQNYLDFVVACHSWVGDKNIQVACKKFQVALAQAGHDVAGLKTMRLVELALFLQT